MKNLIKLLFFFITITSFLFVTGLIVTFVPTFVLFILKFVVGYSWNVVLIPTYLVMIFVSLVGIGSMFSPRLRHKLLRKRKFK